MHTHKHVFLFTYFMCLKIYTALISRKGTFITYHTMYLWKLCMRRTLPYVHFVHACREHRQVETSRSRITPVATLRYVCRKQYFAQHLHIYESIRMSLFGFVLTPLQDVYRKDTFTLLATRDTYIARITSDNIVGKYKKKWENSSHYITCILWKTILLCFCDCCTRTDCMYIGKVHYAYTCSTSRNV